MTTPPGVGRRMEAHAEEHVIGVALGAAGPPVQHREEPTRPPDLDFCSRCHEHTDFECDEVGDWLSVCCSAQPVEMG